MSSVPSSELCNFFCKEKPVQLPPEVAVVEEHRRACKRQCHGLADVRSGIAPEELGSRRQRGPGWQS